MSATNISNILYAQNKQLQKIVKSKIELFTEAPITKKATRIGSQIVNNTTQVFHSKDPGEAFLLASKLCTATQLLIPGSGIVATHAKWSLAAGYGTSLYQGRKLNSYYTGAINYPDKLESFWEKKSKDTSFMGKVMMSIPRYTSTFSARVTALALETIVGVITACAKSIKSIATEELSKRIKDCSKKDHAFLAAQILGIALVALPTIFYFSKTISNGLRTIGSATLTYESFKFIKEKSIEAIQVDCNGYSQKIDEKIQDIKGSALSKKEKIEAWIKSGSPKKQMIKKATLVTGAILIGSIAAPILGITLYRGIKSGIAITKAALPTIKYMPHLFASAKFLNVAFPEERAEELFNLEAI